MMSSFVDVTPQKRAQEALRQSEAELAIRNRIASMISGLNNALERPKTQLLQ